MLYTKMFARQGKAVQQELRYIDSYTPRAALKTALYVYKDDDRVDLSPEYPNVLVDLPCTGM